MSQTSVVLHALNPLLADALRKKGYDTLTAVQTAVADPKLADRDMLVSSRTGSGKTVAYGLGMASSLLPTPLPEQHEAAEGYNSAFSSEVETGSHEENALIQEDRAKFRSTLIESRSNAQILPPAGKPLALIIAPTRELALQVQRELRWLYEATGAIITSCVGGMDQRAERKHLERGVHIVVGTPGRLVDHLTRGALQLDQLAVVVLDEADEMLDLGFREDLELILAATPEKRRTLLFSATLPKSIVALTTRFQRNAARIEVATDVSGHVDIEHRAAMVRPNAIEKGVVNLLRQTDSPAALVFCNTRDAVRHLHATLIERGFSAVILSGELGQHERNQALQALRDGRARVCIATDVAARGIDLPSLGLVIHADLPHDSEVLQHRSGRTGRAGRKGISVMLVPPNRRSKAHRLYAEGGIAPKWVPLPTAEEIHALDHARILADESAFSDLADADRDMGAALLAARPAEEIAAALARVFRARFPEPEDIDPLPLEEMRPAKKDGKKGPRSATLEGGTIYRWFELSVGRQDRAEPKGILRMLTRNGGVERHQIGGIRIHDKVCHVEIAAEIADRFEKRHANPAPDDIRVRRIEEPGAKPKRSFGGPKENRFKGEKPKGEKHKGDMPRGESFKSENPKGEQSKGGFAKPSKEKPYKHDSSHHAASKPPHGKKPENGKKPRDGKKPFKKRDRG